MTGNDISNIEYARLNPFIVACRIIESIGNVFPFKIAGIAYAVVISRDGHTQRVAFELHGCAEINPNLVKAYSIRDLNKANQPVFILMGSTLSIAVHVGISRALMCALMPFLIAVCTVSCEHAETIIEVFIKQNVDFFCRGSCRRIATISFVVDVGAAVGIGEDGKMIGGVGL